VLSDRAYNILKHFASAGLPGLITLYFTLAQIWHLPNTEQVMGTASAVNMFLGAILGISTVRYNNSDAKYVGAIEVTDDGTKKTFSLNLKGSPEDLESLDSATFKVSPVQVPPGSVV
jgi:hypothetical protein